MTNKKIGTLEAIGFVLTVMINHIILNLPKNILDTTASGAFLKVIFITCIALIFVYLISRLFERFPSLDIFDIANFLGGKWLKNLIRNFIFRLFYFYNKHFN